jgi:hypothetical protein
MRLLFHTSVGINIPVSADSFERGVEEQFVGCVYWWQFGLGLF